MLGNGLAFGRDPLGFLTDVADEYGPLATVDVGQAELYVANDPALVEHVLASHNERYVKGELFQRSLRPTLGNGLLTSEGEFWRSQRHTIEPAFHPAVLADAADTMVAYTERTLADWTHGETRDIHADMMALTVEIVAQVLFDVDIREWRADVGNALETVMDRVATGMRRPFDMPLWLPTPGNREFSRAVDTLDDVADAIVATSDPGDGSVVGRLLDTTDHEGRPLSRRQVRDEVVTLLLAGHETTALALTYTLHALGETPPAEAALHDEVDALDGPPTLADLPDLEVTERTVTEGMRLYPPVWELVREAAEPDELAGYQVPEGTTVAVHQWTLHRDDRFYDDPLAFRPERWDGGLRAANPAFAYFPFGGGPRCCVGERFALMEARLALATIAREWRLRPEDDLSFRPSITLRPVDGVAMTVERRD
ncbi:cytochrome P450 [Halobacterium wangiae]|uniref:cytochrome P450 n=1 Tax=Halobacterium wangiae TaxID=2902623 RepID=UPI003D7C0F1B